MLSLRRVEPGDVLGALVVALSGLAWGVLWAWHRAPGGHALHHHGLSAAGDDPGLLGSFLGGWLVMVVAMMLPTQLPLLGALTRTGHGASALGCGGVLLAGYLAAWALYGVAVYTGARLLPQVVAALPWLRQQVWAFGAASLIMAGSYQLSPAKRALLEAFHARGDSRARHGEMRGGVAGALTLGLRHGIGCVGCCWALMLLMFGAGAGSFAWMLTLGAIMALEKTGAWGRRLVVPLGLALIVSGLLVLAFAAPAS